MTQNLQIILKQYIAYSKYYVVLLTFFKNIYIICGYSIYPYTFHPGFCASCPSSWKALPTDNSHWVLSCFLHILLRYHLICGNILTIISKSHQSCHFHSPLLYYILIHCMVSICNPI